MDISNYLSGITNNITSVSTPDSISPVIVGGGFSDLANITKANVDAISATTVSSVGLINTLSATTATLQTSITSTNTAVFANTTAIGKVADEVESSFKNINNGDNNTYWTDKNGYVYGKVDATTGKLTFVGGVNGAGSGSTSGSTGVQNNLYSQVICDANGFVKKTIGLDGRTRTAPDSAITWSAFGDSITAYNDTLPTGVGITKGWITLIKDELSITSHLNYGVGGTGIGQLWGSLSGGTQTIGDINTILIGTNDWTQNGAGGALPGTIADYTGNTGNGTYAAYMRKIIDYIKGVNPLKYIILCTPLYRGAVSGTTKPEADTPINGIWLSQYVDLCFTIGKYEGIPVVDLFYAGPINKANCSIRTGNFVTTDGVHPNDEGYRRMAVVVSNSFRKHIYQLNKN